MYFFVPSTYECSKKLTFLFYTGMSTRSYTAAKPHSKDFNIEAGEELVGTTEMVEGCVVEHGELWNDVVRIHYVECGDKSGDLVNKSINPQCKQFHFLQLHMKTGPMPNPELQHAELYHRIL